MGGPLQGPRGQCGIETLGGQRGSRLLQRGGQLVVQAGEVGGPVGQLSGQGLHLVLGERTQRGSQVLQPGGGVLSLSDRKPGQAGGQPVQRGFLRQPIGTQPLFQFQAGHGKLRERLLQGLGPGKAVGQFAQLLSQVLGALFGEGLDGFHLAVHHLPHLAGLGQGQVGERRRHGHHPRRRHRHQHQAQHPHRGALPPQAIPIGGGRPPRRRLDLSDSRRAQPGVSRQFPGGGKPVLRSQALVGPQGRLGGTGTTHSPPSERRRHRQPHQGQRHAVGPGNHEHPGNTPHRRRGGRSHSQSECYFSDQTRRPQAPARPVYQPEERLRRRHRRPGRVSAAPATPAGRSPGGPLSTDTGR